MTLELKTRSKQPVETTGLLSKDSGSLGYKNQHYMSASSFLTMAEEIQKQRKTAAHLSRSASIGIDMASSAFNPILEVLKLCQY